MRAGYPRQSKPAWKKQSIAQNWVLFFLSHQCLHFSAAQKYESSAPAPEQVQDASLWKCKSLTRCSMQLVRKKSEKDNNWTAAIQVHLQTNKQENRSELSICWELNKQWRGSRGVFQWFPQAVLPIYSYSSTLLLTSSHWLKRVPAEPIVAIHPTKHTWISTSRVLWAHKNPTWPSLPFNKIKGRPHGASHLISKQIRDAYIPTAIDMRKT